MSVYYSHVLQMLFFSYCQGRSFAATISRTTLEVLQLFSINIKRWGSALTLELPQRPCSTGKLRALPGPLPSLPGSLHWAASGVAGLASLHGWSPQAVGGSLWGPLSLRRKSCSQGSKCDFNLMREFSEGNVSFFLLAIPAALDVSLLVGVGVGTDQ